MATLIHCDGHLGPPEEARVSILDRAFLYGDSVYETLRTYQGRPFELGRHLDRLEQSLAQLRIDPGVARAEIERRVLETLAAAKNPESYIRIVVSRGIGEFGLANFSGKGAVHVIVRPLTPFPEESFQRGIALILAKTRRVAKNALDPGIKSGNYLNSLFGLMEAKDAGADDAVFLNERNFLTEASTSSLFLVKNGVLLTPPVSAGILAGITRFHTLAAALDAQIPTEERDLTEAELRAADEIFLTGTLKEIVPARSLVGKALVCPGPLTCRLRDLFSARIRALA